MKLQDHIREGTAPARQPLYFLSHGGGPWPFMQGTFRSAFSTLEHALQAIPSALPQPPEAILVISGHWEESEFTVSTAARPGMLYDYAGFPEETYRVEYPAPGHPQIAEHIAQWLEGGGWTIRRDDKRGYDHGTFCMMQAMYPKADIPIVQLSMKRNLDPEAHFAIGQRLQALRDQNILILGSGQSFHNLAVQGMPYLKKYSLDCDATLRRALSERQVQRRKERLIEWMQSDYGHFAHPRIDHLMPLFVILGAANDLAAQLVYGNFVMDVATTNVCFYEAPLSCALDTFSTPQSVVPERM